MPSGSHSIAPSLVRPEWITLGTRRPVRAEQLAARKRADGHVRARDGFGQVLAEKGKATDLRSSSSLPAMPPPIQPSVSCTSEPHQHARGSNSFPKLTQARSTGAERNTVNEQPSLWHTALTTLKRQRRQPGQQARWRIRTRLGILTSRKSRSGHIEGEVAPVRLRDSGQPWWTVPEQIEKAAETWEGQLSLQVRRAQQVRCLTLVGPHADAERCFDNMINNVRTSRVLLPVVEKPKKLQMNYNRQVKKTTGPVWDLMASIWAPRAKWADSKSLWDTDEVELRRFDADWKELRKLGIVQTILKNDDGDSDSEDGDHHADGLGEVQDCHDVLWEFHDLSMQLFLHYSAATESIHSIDRISFTDFTDDFELASNASQGLRRCDMDRLFQVINLKGKALNKSSAVVDEDDERALNRLEFLACLVHIGIIKYVATGLIRDVSDALHELFSKLDARAANALGYLGDPNVFRDRYCYVEEVDKVLRKHETALRILFKAVAAPSEFSSKAGYSTKEANLLSLQEFMQFVRAAGLSGADLSERDARMSFSWSRMVVVNTSTAVGVRKQCNLPFEGFLECLIRLSILKALPTDCEIIAKGADNAGHYMKMLEEEEPGLVLAFKTARKTALGGEPRQPVDRCVDHLISIIIRSVESTKGSGDMNLTESEMSAFAKAKLVIV
jgi:hypothetical protein